MSLEPIGDRIIVDVELEPEKTAGGIFLPEKAREKTLRGHVVACGPGKINLAGKFIPMEVPVGALVYYAKYSGEDYTHEGKTYHLIKESDILAMEV